MTRASLVFRLLFAAAVLGTPQSSPGQCLKAVSGFRLPGPSDTVLAVETLDLGTGPALYAGGEFTNVEGIPANRVARWDGTTWTALGAGVDGDVTVFASFTDAIGPAVFVGGSFANAGGASASRIARWDGAAWSPLGSGVDGAVEAMVVFDDGSGASLYVAGKFTHAGGASADHVAKWDGTNWSDVGGGTDGNVHALAVFDDGSGPALYAGGSFSTAGGSGAANVARWNGTSWSALAAGASCPVTSMESFDDGSGAVLCAGSCEIIAWDGVAWNPLGPGGPFEALDMESFDDGSGPALYTGSHQGGPPVVMKWDGATWSGVTAPWTVFAVHTFAVFDGGQGPALHAGAEVSFQSVTLPLFLARLDGPVWVPVGDANGLNGGVHALALFDDGSGDVVFAGGPFTAAGKLRADHVARFDGESWSPLQGGGVLLEPVDAADVHAMTGFDDGSGQALFVGGVFSLAGGVPASNVARWNGATWTALGTGLDGEVRAMVAFDDGTGPALYVAGDFATAGGSAASRIARWNGTAWSDVDGGADGRVNSLVVFDDGSGPALYAAGEFTHAGGTPTNGIAKWSPPGWTALQNTVGNVTATAVFDHGSGQALYLANAFTPRLERFDGQTWTLVGANTGECGASALQVFDDGSGPELFLSANPCAKGFSTLMRWDGKNRADVATVPAIGIVLSTLVDSSSRFWTGAELPASFPGLPASGVALWEGCSPPGVPFCFGDGSSGTCPCGNLGSPGRGCQNSVGTGGAALSSSGVSSLSADSVLFVSTGERTTSLSVFWQGEAELSPRYYGDGLRCVGSRLKRLFTHDAIGGTAAAPQGADLPVSVRSAAVGNVIAPGSRRYYMVAYRDGDPAFCPLPTGSTFNSSNALRVFWHP